MRSASHYRRTVSAVDQCRRHRERHGAQRGDAVDRDLPLLHRPAGSRRRAATRVRRRTLRPAGRQPAAGAMDRGPGRGQEEAPGRAVPPLLGGLLRRRGRGHQGRRRGPEDRGECQPLRPPPRRGPDAHRGLRGDRGPAPHRPRARPAQRRRRRLDLPHGPEPDPRPAPGGRGHRDHHAAVRGGAGGQGAALDPRRLPHRGPGRRGLPREGVPEEAHPHAGGGDRLPRRLHHPHVRQRGHP